MGKKKKKGLGFRPYKANPNLPPLIPDNSPVPAARITRYSHAKAQGRGGRQGKSEGKKIVDRQIIVEQVEF
jgi:hypothetical protein